LILPAANDTIETIETISAAQDSIDITGKL
jgi:hypothetical protein